MWIRIIDQPMPEGRPILTKIDEGGIARNVQQLRREKGLYWTVDSNPTYVYYSPTHWWKPNFTILTT